MSHNNYFQFKQFRIIQEQSAMKIGIDGVLLGAWTNTSKVKTILDVGTGTGLLSIMMAQRSNALITAIEIEKNAADEAIKNVTDSPWKDRINVQHTSFQDFVGSNTKKFDLVVSNPPYFSNALKAKNEKRNLARHNDNLTYNELLIGANNLLSDAGIISIILPHSMLGNILMLAENINLHIQKITVIKSKPSREPHRVLIQLGKVKCDVQKSTFVIYEDNNSFTRSFRELTHQFYLKF